eukprot:scaffold2907_cov112-Isochrysis_galbana.AAC.3
MIHGFTGGRRVRLAASQNQKILALASARQHTPESLRTRTPAARCTHAHALFFYTLSTTTCFRRAGALALMLDAVVASWWCLLWGLSLLT